MAGSQFFTTNLIVMKKNSTIRTKGDKILEEMSSIQANFGTGSSRDVGSIKERNKILCEKWRELKRIDPERAELIKPQNPYVK